MRLLRVLALCSFSLFASAEECQQFILAIAGRAEIVATSGDKDQPDYASFLGSLSFAPDGEAMDQLVSEIKALIERSFLFQSGLVAHFFAKEAAIRMDQRAPRDIVLFATNYGLIVPEKKLLLSASIVTDLAVTMDRFQDAEGTDWAKQLKLSSTDYLKMLAYWNSYTREDPFLGKLQLALLVYFQYYTKDLQAKLHSFQKMFSGYGGKWLPFSVARELLPPAGKKLPSIEQLITQSNALSELSIIQSHLERDHNKTGAFTVAEFVALRSLAHTPLWVLETVYLSPKNRVVFTKGSVDLFEARARQLRGYRDSLEPYAAALRAASEAHRKLRSQRDGISSEISDLRDELEALEERAAEVSADLKQLNPRERVKTTRFNSMTASNQEEFVMQLAVYMDTTSFLNFLAAHIRKIELAKKEGVQAAVNLILRIRALSRLKVLTDDQKHLVHDRLTARLNAFLKASDIEALDSKLFDKSTWGAKSETVAEIHESDELVRARKLSEQVQSELERVRTKMTELEASRSAISQDLTQLDNERKARETEQTQALEKLRHEHLP
jgi:predicted  nucleic acid-binding Zn-ribbon protein